MGTLSNHIAGQPHISVDDKSPKPNTELADAMNRADQGQQFMGGSFVATDENGVIGTPAGNPTRINTRMNGKLI